MSCLLLWCAILCILSSFVIILMGMRESWVLHFNCLSDVLCLLLPHGAVGWSAVCD